MPDEQSQRRNNLPRDVPHFLPQIKPRPRFGVSHNTTRVGGESLWFGSVVNFEELGLVVVVVGIVVSLANTQLSR